MRFLVEWRLFLLVGVGAMAGAWIAVSRQRRRDVVRFTNVELLDVIAPREPGWRRHAPAVLFLLALVALVVGFARPVRAMQVGDERATVVLALDTSLSMEADDVEPSRLEVAQEAARAFVSDLPDQLNVGLVVFNGTTAVAVSPTHDREALVAAIDAVELGEGTAIGDAIFTALDAVAAAPRGEDDEPAPARIVVMSDGETTVGRDNAEAAAAAADAGVPVDTIAFGTPDGTIEAERRWDRARAGRPRAARRDRGDDRRHHLPRRLARRARLGLRGHRRCRRVRRGRPGRQRVVRRHRDPASGGGRCAQPGLVAAPTVTGCDPSSPSRSRPSAC